MNRPKTLNRIVALFLVSACAAFLFVGSVRVHADGDGYGTSAIDKCSPDLLQIADSAGATRVKVIVQSSTTSAGLLDSLITDVGGIVLGTLGQLNIRLAEMSAGSAKALAYNTDISFMSLDNEVRSFGHVTNTTGAQQSRSQKTALGLNYTLDGSGVNIAVLDSGIDVNHKSFSAQIGKVVFSKDFTGENRTDDPYGHGTHVAAVATGAGTATSGQYEGLASGSNRNPSNSMTHSSHRTGGSAKGLSTTGPGLPAADTRPPTEMASRRQVAALFRHPVQKRLALPPCML